MVEHVAHARKLTPLGIELGPFESVDQPRRQDTKNKNFEKQ